MGKTKILENFELKEVKRADIKGAPYNPRKMTEKNKRNLKAYIKKRGLLFPAIVINKQTGNLVGGHQRIDILDSLYKNKNYELTASIVDLSLEEEIEANIKLNSHNLVGEWDPEKLFDLKLKYPDMDFEKTFDFEPEEIDIIFAGLEIESAYQEEEKVYQKYQEANKTQLKEAKEKYKQRISQENKTGNTIYTKDDDYTLSLIFKSNQEKWAFMKLLCLSKSEKMIKGKIVADIVKQVKNNVE